MKSAKNKTQPRARATRQEERKRVERKPPPADLRAFYGILSKQEATQMIRDVEEAFEHVDAE